ncbi:MAG: hypothetical protein CMI63_03840 [Parvularcula sp.]|nr:hypothetical protein [Parvularcula sp.]
MKSSAAAAQRIEYDAQQHTIYSRNYPHDCVADLNLDRRTVVAIKSPASVNAVPPVARTRLLVTLATVHDDLNKIFPPHAASARFFIVPIMFGMRSLARQNQMPQISVASMRL